jgi:hypothetical protein
VSRPEDRPRAARRLLREQRRRRRIALIDSVFGLGLALVGLIIAPGIGILALVALLVLGLCGLSLLGGRAFRRRVRAPKRSAQDFDRLQRPRRRHA